MPRGCVPPTGCYTARPPGAAPPESRGENHNDYHPPPPAGKRPYSALSAICRAIWARCLSQPIFSCASALGLVLGAAPSGAWAASPASGEYSRASSLAAGLVSECGGYLKSGARSTANCLESAALRRFSSAALPFALNWVEDSGQRLFGERFSLRNGLQFEFGEGIRGDVDMVLPLAGNQGSAISGIAKSSAFGRALFVQQGASIYTDEDGVRRHDMRFGLVGRSPAWRGHKGIVGLSLFQQYNLERGHSRSVMGLDWTGPKAAAAFNYYLPTTGWLASKQLGYEEIALEGMEFSGRFRLPHSLELESSVGRWRVPGSRSHSRTARAGLAWQYNRWIRLNSQWNQSGIGDGRQSGWSAGLHIRIPLGGRAEAPRRLRDITRYKGHLAKDRGGREAGPEEMWRPVEQEGRIAVVTRDTADARTEDGQAMAAFVGNQVVSGHKLQARVFLAKPAPADRHYELRLTPGGGENPAVEGEDFSSEPVLVRIPKGSSEKIVSIQLLTNYSMKTPRSLDLSITAL